VKWFLYNIAFFLAYLLMTPKWLVRMCRRGGYRAGFMQRLGFYGVVLEKRLAARERIWIHAVSVGEVHVAGGLMTSWRERDPDVAFVVSVNTSTGREVVQRYITAVDQVVYFPCDFPGVVRRVILRLRPRMLVLVEGEYWPNLLRTLARRHIPVSVVNARLSARSLKGYQRMGSLFREAVAGISYVLAQSDVDASRLRQLGMPETALKTVGAAKFDVADPDAASREAGRAILDLAAFSAGRQVVVGGSTWGGEERALAEACLPFADEVLLVLVPRHMERRDEVLADLAPLGGLDVVQRSRMVSGGERSRASGTGLPVLLLDSTGELASMYAVADVVFVGKSLPPNHGGQNMIEPASFGVPLVTGPNTENFPGVMAQFREADAIYEVADPAALTRQIELLLKSVELRQKRGAQARDVVVAQRGATARTLDLLMPLGREL
jgi:3-deoxy-D-manno-octulosonic-acid transferase